MYSQNIPQQEEDSVTKTREYPLYRNVRVRHAHIEALKKRARFFEIIVVTTIIGYFLSTLV